MRVEQLVSFQVLAQELRLLLVLVQGCEVGELDSEVVAFEVLGQFLGHEVVVGSLCYHVFGSLEANVAKNAL